MKSTVSGSAITEPSAPGVDVPVDAAAVSGWRSALSRAAGATSDDADRIDLLRAIEELKCAAEAAQADLAVGLDASMRQRAADAGVPSVRRGRGIAHQIALARRISPHRGTRVLGLATVLHQEMPHTMAAFRAGRIGEWKATLLARETACLEREHRALVDEAVAGDAARIESLSDAQVAAEAARLAAKLDPASVARRRARAEADRRITIRPAPDTMTYLTGLLPVRQGVSVFAALKVAADVLRAAGDERSHNQLMADTLVARVTGQEAAGDPVTLSLVVSDKTLLGGDDEPGHLDGYGPVPADLVREWVLANLGSDIKTWLRTVYADPHGGLVGMSSRARLVPQGLAALLRVRDAGVCRTPWCDAPIRHFDHVVGVEHGGDTVEENLQGLCESCNHAKQAPGWSASGEHPPDGRHRVRTTTPTGHTYSSNPPPLPGQHEQPRRRLVLEIHHRPDLELIHAPLPEQLLGKQHLRTRLVRTAATP